MKSGMRLVIGGATLAAVYLLQATPAFTQAPPWAQQQQQRRYYPPQRQQAAPQAQQQRGPAAQQQTPQQQAPQQQAKPKPEPVPQNTQERAACLNKETPTAALIAACTVIIEAGRDKPSVMATAYCPSR